ncbi:MAG: ABC transporter permease, partial [Deltaproteobacteria bacterium]|nr:ABC transporter permease [Deltaproteobacteria bacterium]
MMIHLFRLNGLIRQLTKREVIGRYKGTYLGLAWSLINPLVLLAVYTFVFAIIFNARFGSGADAGRLDFALNLFCGLILYNVFSSCVGKAPDLVVGNRNYVKRVV